MDLWHRARFKPVRGGGRGSACGLGSRRPSGPGGRQRAGPGRPPLSVGWSDRYRCGGASRCARCRRCNRRGARRRARRSLSASQSIVVRRDVRCRRCSPFSVSARHTSSTRAISAAQRFTGATISLDCRDRGGPDLGSAVDGARWSQAGPADRRRARLARLRSIARRRCGDCPLRRRLDVAHFRMCTETPCKLARTRIRGSLPSQRAGHPLGASTGVARGGRRFFDPDNLVDAVQPRASRVGEDG